MLSTQDADTLAAAGIVLRNEARVATREAIGPTTGTMRAYALGQSAEACNRATDAIFNALNVLTNIAGDDEAKRVLHVR